MYIAWLRFDLEEKMRFTWLDSRESRRTFALCVLVDEIHFLSRFFFFFYYFYHSGRLFLVKVGDDEAKVYETTKSIININTKHLSPISCHTVLSKYSLLCLSIQIIE